MKYRHISVIGAGAWGTALAHHAASKGLAVTLWAYEDEVVDEINSSRRNSVFLEGIELSENITATGVLEEASSLPVIIFAVPSHVMEGIIEQMAPHLDKGTIIVSVAKGIENRRLRLPHQIFDEMLDVEIARKLVSLSGPSFAREVAQGLPAAVTCVSRHGDSARVVQELLSDERLRIYTHDDMMGVELGGALKNVIAIAAGISDGLGLGCNARAALITRGLAEMTRLVKKMGGRDNTLAGLAGIGDLILTATGDLSRNRTVGMRLGKGESIGDITSGMKAVAEGVRTSRSIYELAGKMDVDMPLCMEVYMVCHEGKSPRDAVKDLMARSLKDEFYG